MKLRELFKPIFFGFAVTSTLAAQQANLEIHRILEHYRLTPPTNGANCDGYTPIPFSETTFASPIVHCPKYPTEAKIKRISGVVVIQLCVDTKGRAVSCTVISGPSELRPSVESYALTLQFKPYIIEGTAANVTFYMAFPFRLR